MFYEISSGGIESAIAIAIVYKVMEICILGSLLVQTALRKENFCGTQKPLVSKKGRLILIMIVGATNFTAKIFGIGLLFSFNEGIVLTPLVDFIFISYLLVNDVLSFIISLRESRMGGIV